MIILEIVLRVYDSNDDENQLMQVQRFNAETLHKKSNIPASTVLHDVTDKFWEAAVLMGALD